MEYLKIGEKTFVKAAKVAQNLGYTADYIGQLCRSGKVNAKLVGRTWYVEEASVKAHKKGRYRSVKSVATKELKRRVKSEAARGHSVPLRTALSPAATEEARRRQATPARYLHDDSALMPIPIKKYKQEAVPESTTAAQSIPITSAEAVVATESVPVKSKRSVTTFEASELPKVRFKGKLKVASAEDEEEISRETEPKQEEEATATTSTDAPASDPAVADDAPDDSTPVSADVVLDDATKVAMVAAKKPTPTKQPKKVVGKAQLPAPKTTGSVDGVRTEQVREVAATATKRPASAAGHWLLRITITFVLLVVALVVLSIRHQVIVDDSSITNQYILDIYDTISFIKSYFKQFLG